MRRALRWSLHVASAALGLAMLLAVAAVVVVVALSRGWQREPLVAFVARQLGDALDAEVRIDRIEGALFDGFRAEGVELRAGDRPPLAASAVTVRLDPSPLWRERRLAIARLEIEGLRGAVARGEEGWLVSGFGRPLGGPGGEDAVEEPPALRAVEIDELELRDARLELALGADGAADATRAALTVEGQAAGLRWRAGAPARLPALVEARLALAPSTIAGRAVERGALALSLVGVDVRIARAELAGPFGAVALADGEARLADDALPPRLAGLGAQARVSALDLGVLAGEPRLASRLDGPLSFTFVPDDPDAPAAGRLEAEAELTSQPIAGVAVDTIRFRGGVHTGTRAFSLEEARVAGPPGVVEGRGAGGPDAIERLALRADLALGALPEAWRGPLSGRLRAEASASGPWRDPRGTLAARVEELRIGERGPGTFALRGEATGERRVRVDELALALPDLAVRSEGPAQLRFAGEGAPDAVVVESLALVAPGVRAQLRGRAGADSLRALRADVVAEDLAAAGASLGLGTPLAGRLAGWLEADGPLRAPALRGELSAAPLAVGETRVDGVEATVRSDERRVWMEGAVRDGGSPRARFEAAASREALFSEPGALLARADTELRLRAEALDLAWLAALAGAAPGDASGRLDADVRLAGASPAPRATGFLRVAEGRVPVPGLADPLGPIAADLRLEGAALRVAAFHVPGSEGEIRGTGALGWDAAAGAPSDTDLRVRFDRFALPPGGDVAGVLDGELALRGLWPELRLDGRVAMDPGLFRAPARRDPAWEEIRIHGLDEEEPVASTPLRAAAEPPPELPGVLERTAIDVALAFEPGSRFTGEGADVLLEGEVRLLKQPAEDPLFVGSIRTTSGEYRFRGRRFAIERGAVTFAGTRTLDPELDVVAAQQIGEVTLRVVVSGRASAPVVTLESEPPLDPTDQLSYLAFGRPAESLSASDSAQLEAVATQVVGQLLLESSVGATFLEQLPLGRIQVQTAGGPEAGGLSVGAEVLRGVRVFYARDLGAGESGARMEWRFHPRWMIQSEIEEDGGTAADLIWNYDF